MDLGRRGEGKSRTMTLTHCTRFEKNAQVLLRYHEQLYQFKTAVGQTDGGRVVKRRLRIRKHLAQPVDAPEHHQRS